METGAFVRISANLTAAPGKMKTLSVIIDNSCSIEPQAREDGTFRSTKNKGNGVGITSVRNIAARYNGASSFQYKDGIFTASVLLNNSMEKP